MNVYQQDRLSRVHSDLGLALGLARMLTLLPLHDPALDEIERLVARAARTLGQLEVPPGLDDGEEAA